ncbi:hypothetical protein UFOVP314_56 [uncultured Caudovirales phage]|uniref:Uncharacterized protein n=1 Tax=uncultured Caudovirales phage TaxID=2100421 RepID=A0A6J5LS11_9CAUD|nr:hypothetical protein UFOVP314_56 [uncultured Caudovirales phage]
MPDTFDLGDRPVVTVTFRDELGVVRNPTTVQFSYRRPNGTVVAGLSPGTNPSVGVYTLQLPVLDQTGPWTYRAVGTGTIDAAVEGRFFVRRSAFA